jgi:hypothetical protein
MDYMGPGLAVTDRLVDRHFDKIPTKFFDKNTYKPRSRRNSRRNSQQVNSSSSSESDSGGRATDRRHRNKKRLERADAEARPIPEVEEIDDMSQQNSDIPRHSGQGVGPAYNYDSTTAQQYDYLPIYSHDPPRSRPQYIPAPPPGQPYFPPPPRSYSPYQSQRGRDRNYDSDDGFSSNIHHSTRRRPHMVTRRSSSYHGPRDRRDYSNSYDSDAGTLQRRRGSETGAIAKVKDINHRYGLKEEAQDVLTTSKAGLAGGVVGAAVGGWAANKAQVAYGKDKGRHESSNPILTLLGAAAGGLVVDAVVARYEDKKREAEIKEKKWDKKWGDGNDAGRVGESGRRGESGRKIRGRRDSYSDSE